MANRALSITTLTTFGFASVLSLPAQYTGEAATIITPAASYAPLGPAALGVTGVYSLRLVPHASLPAGTYYCCARVSKPATSGFKLQTGTFNVQTGVYVKNADIDTVNVGVNGSFSVSSDLLTAVFNSYPTPRYATRPNLTSQFTLQPAGIPLAVDEINFGRVNGQDVLFYVVNLGGTIVYQTFSNGALIGPQVTVHTFLGNEVFFSVMPVNDSTGETRGVAFAEFDNGPRLVRYTSLLPRDTTFPPKTLYSTGASIQFGDCTGGLITLPQFNGQAPIQLGVALTSSSNYPALAATNVKLASFAPPQSASALPYNGVTAIGPLAPAGVTLGGVIVGNFSLSGLSLLPFGVFSNTNGTFEQTIPVPPLPLGLKIYLQTFTCIPTNCYLSNTGRLQWK